MNKLVLVFQKLKNSSGPKLLRGYFRARCSLKNVRTALQILASFSRELPHNNPNSKVTLLLLLFLSSFKLPAQNIFFFLRRVSWFLQCFNILSFNCQGLSNHLRLIGCSLE